MRRPGFYPHRPQRVRLVQTHISWVFLAGPLVYKVKKPVNFGFVDFSTLARRAGACAAEVALNRRLAPELYLGVAPVHAGADGFSLQPPGRVVEYAVVMRRLAADRLLSTLLARGEATAAQVRRVARRVAAFHAGAAPAAARFRGVGNLRGNLQENFRQTLPFLGRTVASSDYLLVWDYNHDFLERRGFLLGKRVRDGRIRDGHGDLHAEHVCLGRRLEIYDCVEFSARIRQGDVAADVAFLYMDLLYHREPELARVLMEEYLRSSGDWEVRLLVAFYACYRAVVREKVESFRLADPGVPLPQKKAAARRAARYFRLARDLARRDARPRLFLVGGLPGSGKSTVARALDERVGADGLATDALRKELAGAPANAHLPAPPGGGIYGAEMTELTYHELFTQAERQLRAGRSVVLDATFQRERHRRRAAALARATGALLVGVECRCPERVARERLAERARSGDALSDAGGEVRRAMRLSYEQPGPDTVRVDTTKPLEGSLARIAERAYPL
jgi:aminoglycoside phosphotransferase family enzyme/predicted kinase